MRTSRGKGFPGLSLFIMTALVAVSFTACANSNSGGNDPTSLTANGAGLISWNGNLYVVGGIDSGGAYRAEVWRASVASDGSVGQWSRDADLPAGIAYASCFAYGRMAYVIGGRDGGGLRSTVYYTLINDDGHLGFSNSTWTPNTRSLPEARASAAPLIVGNRLFLLGGETASGKQSSALSAGVWDDGQVGQWYESPNPLPAAGLGYAAATYEGKLYLCGGNTGSIYSSTPDANRLPGAWTSVAYSSGTIVYPAMAWIPAGLAIFGGIDQASNSYGKTCCLRDGVWADYWATSVTGPHCPVVAGNPYVVSSIKGADSPSLSKLSINASGQTSRADTPSVAPGDGAIVRTNEAIHIMVYPGDSVYFTTAAYGTTPSDPTQSSTIFNASSPPRISATAAYAFRAFHTGASPSPIVYASYRALSSSMFVLIKSSIVPSPSPGSNAKETLTEKYSDGSSANVSSVWFKIIVSSRSSIALGWADASDDSSSYSAHVSVSLYEVVDGSVPARLTDGSELYNLANSAARPVHAVLGPGEYYLLVQSTDGATGGSFGVSVASGS